MDVHFSVHASFRLNPCCSVSDVLITVSGGVNKRTLVTGIATCACVDMSAHVSLCVGVCRHASGDGETHKTSRVN